jgi:glutaredoxin 3
MPTAIRTRIDSTIANHAVVLFSRTTCKYCYRVKDLLASLGVVPFIVELNQDQQGSEIQGELLAMTKSMTAPSVWIGGKYIGGSNDTATLNNQDKLMPAVNAARAALLATTG